MDVLESTVSHLSSKLGVRVSTERPANPPAEMVTVTRTGGGGGAFTERPRVTVHCWAESEKLAYRLGMRAAEAMFSLPSSDDNIASVTQDSFYSNIYPDGTRRWTGAYVMVCNR